MIRYIAAGFALLVIIFCFYHVASHALANTAATIIQAKEFRT